MTITFNKTQQNTYIYIHITEVDYIKIILLELLKIILLVEMRCLTSTGQGQFSFSCVQDTIYVTLETLDIKYTLHLI